MPLSLIVPSALAIRLASMLYLPSQLCTSATVLQDTGRGTLESLVEILQDRDKGGDSLVHVVKGTEPSPSIDDVLPFASEPSDTLLHHGVCLFGRAGPCGSLARIELMAAPFREPDLLPILTKLGMYPLSTISNRSPGGVEAYLEHVDQSLSGCTVEMGSDKVVSAPSDLVALVSPLLVRLSAFKL